MKKLLMTLMVTMVTMVTMAVAGGNIAPINAKVAPIITEEPCTSATATGKTATDCSFYLTLGIGVREIRDMDDLLLGGTLGYNLNEYLSAEVNYYHSEPSQTVSTFAMFNLPINDLTLSAGMGYNWTTISDKQMREISVTDNKYEGLSGKIRATYFLTNQMGLYTEVVHHMANSKLKEDVRNDTYGLVGFLYRF